MRLFTSLLLAALTLSLFFVYTRAAISQTGHHHPTAVKPTVQDSSSLNILPGVDSLSASTNKLATDIMQ